MRINAKSVQIFFKSISILCFVLFNVSALAQGSFSSAIDDLPLMDGLNESEGETLVFDSSSGRIVEALSTGEVSRQQVMSFYSETLPQLGWQEISKGYFLREDEVLKIEISNPKKEKILNVYFMLSPAK